jgi:hypothetical protein
VELTIECYSHLELYTPGDPYTYILKTGGGTVLDTYEAYENSTFEFVSNDSTIKVYVDGFNPNPAVIPYTAGDYTLSSYATDGGRGTGLQAHYVMNNVRMYTTGPPGPAGPAGTNGTQGATGPTGPQGNQGGFQYSFDATVYATHSSADIGTGIFAFNSATASSVTSIYMNTETREGTPIGSYLFSWNNSGISSGRKGTLVFKGNVNNNALYCIFNVTTVGFALLFNPSGNWVYPIDVTYVEGTIPTDLQACTFLFIPDGYQGATGANGATGPLGTSSLARLTISAVTGTTLNSSSSPAISTATYSTYYNITTPAFNTLTLPSTTDTGAFWVLRNNTTVYLTFNPTYTSGSGPTTLSIPPSSAVTLAWNGTAFVLF